MQIIIPMSGEGSRFKRAGYTTLKPLIKVNGKSIIEYVIEMFPGDHEFLFICRKDHLEEYNLGTYLPTLAKNTTIVSIDAHKLGPVYATLQAESYVNKEIPVILTYCDYFMDWNFNDFSREVIEENQDGNVICYSGFHPHLLHEKNVYAGCRINESNDLLEIKEKFSFEADKTLAHHSGGAYYFKNGEMLLKYFKKSISSANNAINGEYYVSMVYQPMLEDHLKIKVYDKVDHFFQWGTPEDLEEYLYWSDIFLKHDYK